MTRIMIREGQNVNEKTQIEGNSSLHIAARNGHYLVVKYLLEIGAGVSQVNSKGMTARQFLQEALISGDKLEKLIARQKKPAQGQKIRSQQKLMADTFKLLEQAENDGGKQRA